MRVLSTSCGELASGWSRSRRRPESGLLSCSTNWSVHSPPLKRRVTPTFQDTALIELANCQSQLVRSVPMERYEKLALRLKKECVAEALGSDLDEVWRENVASLAPTTDVKKEELEAKNAYLKV